MAGFLVYLPTIQGIPHFASFLAIFYLILRNNAKIHISKQDINALVIIALMLLNYIIFGILNKSLIEFPKFLFFIITILIGKYLNVKDLRIILYFILIETSCAILQHFLKINSFFVNDFSHLHELGSNLLYYKRVVGLSDGPTTLAIKILVSLVLIKALDIPRKAYIACFIVLWLGLIFTFSRAAILSSVILEFIYVYFYIGTNKTRKILLSIITVIGISILWFYYGEIIIEQLFRGKENIDLSSRDLIWIQYFDFIKENFLLGNGSSKTYLEVPQYGEMQAHNSYIQFLASNGILISFIFWLWIAGNISKKNILFLIPFFIFSVANYGIFWVISFMDIFFFKFLLYPEINDNDIQIKEKT